MNTSDLAKPFWDALEDIGVPVVFTQNAAIDFVDEMPAGITAPHRSKGITRTTVPAILFEHLPTIRRDPTLGGGATIAEGYVLLTVVTQQNRFGREANRIAADIMALFPMGTRLARDGGTVLVPKPASPLSGYDDGKYWRVPVQVDYRTAA